MSVAPRRRVLARLLVGTATLTALAVVSAVVAPPASAWSAPNDPEWSKQFGPVQIGAPDAWSKSTGAGVTVAVVDSGVDLDHPEFEGKLVQGRDFSDDDNNADDDSPLEDGSGKSVMGHGTSGAGVIGAITNNGVGIAGVAPDVKIMPLKVFPSKEGGGGLLNLGSDVPDAINYAVANGAKVINLSLGTFSFGFLGGAIETPCQNAYRSGVLCVVSSGNDRENQQASGYDRGLQALLVGATDSQGKPTSFAQNADTQWAATAPGQAIITTTTLEQGSYATVSGTSFSAPHASGVAALLFAQGLPVDQVVKRMLDTAVSIGEPNRNGAGILNATAAVGATPTEPPADGPKPQGPTGSVLLPKAATRSGGNNGSGQSPAGPSVTAAPAATDDGSGDLPTDTTLPPEENPDDFAADLANQSTETGQPASANRASDAGDIGFYTVSALAGVLVLGTGTSALGKFRRRRS